MFCAGAAAAAYEDDSGEDHDGRDNLLPAKCLYSKGDAEPCGDERLEVAVHAHKSRTDVSLADRDEEIADDCGKDDQVSKLPDEVGRDGLEVNIDDLIGRYRQGHGCCKEEYPFEICNHGIFGDQWLEQSQIECKDDAVDDHQDDAHRMGLAASSTMHAVEDEEEYAGKA